MHAGNIDTYTHLLLEGGDYKSKTLTTHCLPSSHHQQPFTSLPNDHLQPFAPKRPPPVSPSSHHQQRRQPAASRPNNQSPAAPTTNSHNH
ncbi:hypothetical protein A4A49_41966 [Nicotiana attenuata]|uniref:Uncharacterized protein n=1 Tax=Nicotiana attenuata TaxID=49451 RepID=A0A1J6KK21_NICAT|nr:hypothetical protein A4A49_41966 [Nicotiana attenuata]